MPRNSRNYSEITAVVLAGGLGTRLGSIVKDKPKVLAEILNRPFLTFLLDQLVSVEVRKVVLCTAHLSDKIHEVLGETYKTLSLVHSRETELLGTGGAIRLALPHLDSNPVLIMNGDSFADVDLTAYLDWFFKRPRRAALLLTRVHDRRRYGRVTIDKDGLILGFEEKGSADGSGLINAGIYLLEKPLIDSMPPGKSFSLELDLFPTLAGKEFYGYCFTGGFIDIGTPESYFQAENTFRKILP